MGMILLMGEMQKMLYVDEVVMIQSMVTMVLMITVVDRVMIPQCHQMVLTHVPQIVKEEHDVMAH
jgi:hypothetical protein